MLTSWSRKFGGRLKQWQRMEIDLTHTLLDIDFIPFLLLVPLSHDANTWHHLKLLPRFKYEASWT